MTETEITLVVGAAGSVVAAVAAGAKQTLSGVGTFLKPFLDELVSAAKQTAEATTHHTMQLNDIRAQNGAQSQDHIRIEALARQAVDLCEQILAEVKKQ